MGKRSLTPNPSRPHPQLLSKERGEWCALNIARLLLVNLLSTSFTPCPSRPHPQPFSKERGEWYALYIARLLLVNWLTRQLLCFSLDYFFCPLFSKSFNTNIALFIYQPTARSQKIDSREGLFSFKMGLVVHAGKMNIYFITPPFSPYIGPFLAKCSAFWC